MRYDVALAACKSYEDAEVSAALETAVTAAGGLDWVTPGMRVALKLNLVSAMKPEEAATVHPAVVCALVRMLQARGAHVVLGDSPGGLYNAAHLQRVYDVTGLRAAEALGAELNGDFSVCSVSYPEAVQARSFTETAYLRNADAIIDVCKLKTHGMMGMTNAVKNFFGTIPGTRKPEMHYRYPNAADFCSMLVDLALFNAPRLTLVDAVDCMEGNGPTQGTPRHMGALLAADTPFNADLVCARLIGMEAMDAPSVAEAVRRGLCPADWRDLGIAGDVKRFAIPDFEKLPVNGSTEFGTKIPFGGAFMRRAFSARPKVDAAKCIGCGKCAELCPPKAAQVVEGRARIEAKKCIRCFCCQEFCPKGAVTVHRPLLARLLAK